MRSASVFLRLGALVIMLALVVVGMRAATPEAMQRLFAALGAEPGEGRQTLCKTRLKAIRFSDGRAVVETRSGLRLNWTAEESTGGTRNASSIGYIEMEKWLARYCEFEAAPTLAGDTASGAMTSTLFEFIDGSSWNLVQNGARFFPTSEPKKPFVSPDLESGLAELRRLAGFPVDRISP